MAKYSIITKTEKFFIGSLAACSYRIQYPVLDGAPTEINGFFERFAMALYYCYSGTNPHQLLLL